MNYNGDLGIGSLNSITWGNVKSTAPVQLPTGLIVSAVATAGAHTCVLFSIGKVSCFGTDYLGQLGDAAGWYASADKGDSPSEMGNNLPFVPLPTVSLVKEIAAGSSHTCVVLVNGNVYCWGMNSYGELGIGSLSYVGWQAGQMGDAMQQAQLPTGKKADKVSCGNYFTCVLSFPSSVYCWGWNGCGQLGVGSMLDVGDGPGEMGNNLKAVPLPGTFTDVRAISAGMSSTCVLNADGKVACWGNNGYGQLGIESSVSAIGRYTSDIILPVLLPPTLNAIQVSCSDRHACALFHDGSIGCWGTNEQGRLGLGVGTGVVYLVGQSTGTMGAALGLVQLPTNKKKK